MPIYEYRCDTCQKTLEIMQKFSDAPLEKCETCGEPVQKLMSLNSFALKGAGWYTTDYKRSARSQASSQAQAPAQAPAKTGSSS